MSCDSQESTSSADKLDVKIDVNSTLSMIKAAMKSTLPVIMMSHVEGQCDEATDTPTVFKLKRALQIGSQASYIRGTRLTYSDAWKGVSAHAKESLAKLQNAYEIMLNTKRKLICVEKLYGTEKAQQMLQQEYLSHGRSKPVKVKSNARSKASKEKSAHLIEWHSCMKDARKNLGIVGKAFPKKDTAYYNECKRLMLEKK